MSASIEKHTIDPGDLDGDFRQRLAAHHSSTVNKVLDAVVLVRDGMASVVFRVCSHKAEIVCTADLGSAVRAYNET